jgi:siroheme synthase-like protein
VAFTPAFFAGQGVLVVGGGTVAERRVSKLLAAGAKVRLIAPALTSALRQLRAAGSIEWIAREWQTGDVAGYSQALLVFAATDNPAINQAVAAEARSAGRLVNLADDSTHSDFILPGVVQSGEITLTVTSAALSAQGEIESSPALTVHLKQRLAEFIGPEYSKLARLLRELRPAVKAHFPESQRSALWRRLIASQALSLLKAGREEEAKSLLLRLVEEATNPSVKETSNA